MLESDTCVHEMQMVEKYNFHLLFAWDWRERECASMSNSPMSCSADISEHEMPLTRDSSWSMTFFLWYVWVGWAKEGLGGHCYRRILRMLTTHQVCLEPHAVDV